jgi:mono/diheme cytochrome c family protein
MSRNIAKLIAITLFAVPLVVGAAFKAPAAAGTIVAVSEPAAEYKAKCAACHAPNASKFYDPAKTDDEHVQAILKGKKGEKPPFMPGFEAKGMTEDGAKALAAYMKGLRSGN